MDDSSIHLVSAMIASPRKDVDLDTIVHNFRLGGFATDLHIFAEPHTVVPNRSDVIVHQNARQLNAFGNYMQALRWMIKLPHADHIMTMEDDIEYARDSRIQLVRAISHFPQYGIISLYTPGKEEPFFAGKQGWICHNPGYKAWGAQSLCFRRTPLENFLNSPNVQDTEKYKPLDAITFQFYEENGLEVYYHNPSFVQHLRKKSSIGSRSRHRGLNYTR